MNIHQYRESKSEKARAEDVVRMLPAEGRSALDLGARDGFFSLKLAERYENVTALDLSEPLINHPSVACVKGDACALPFADDAFDVVLCCEVLEHIPPRLLASACSGIARVTKRHAVIGVPFRQDIRVGRTTCYSCGETNPPWGHANAFNEARIQDLFSGLQLEQLSFVGTNESFTNMTSTFLMDFAGNPYGTYDQDEACIHCGRILQPPPERSIIQKLATRASIHLNRIQASFTRPHPNWIHCRFVKSHAAVGRVTQATMR